MHWRLNKDNIAATRFIADNKQNSSLCKQQLSGKVYIEHMHTRLCQIRDIPYPDYLYVLHASLRGYEYLHNNVGYFQPSENQVCVNGDYRIKIWCNSDLSVMHPESLTRSRGEQEMVREVIHMIMSNADTAHPCQQTFTSFYEQQHNATFAAAIAMVEQYASRNATPIPHEFEAVKYINDDSMDDSLSKRSLLEMSQAS